MTKEIWKPIPGYGDFYEASNMGRIRSKTRIVTKLNAKVGDLRDFVISGKILKNHLRPDGHYDFGGSFNGNRFSLLVHRAILMAFVGMPEVDEEACHNNGIHSDNRINNLRWDTHANNMKDKFLHKNAQRGETHSSAKIKEEDAINIIQGTISIKQAVKLFGIDQATARSIRRGKTWKHLHKKLKENL